MCKCKKFPNAEGIEDILTVYSKNACRVRASGTCSFKRDGDAGIEVYECLANGKCDNSTCICKKGFSANKDGTVCISGCSGLFGSVSIYIIFGVTALSIVGFIRA